MANWLKDTIQALKNLGGQAELSEIYTEIGHIRSAPIPEFRQSIIFLTIQSYSPESQRYNGKHIFTRIGGDRWALLPLSPHEFTTRVITQAINNQGKLAAEAPINQLMQSVPEKEILDNNRGKEDNQSSQKNTPKGSFEQDQRVIDESHLICREFWTQLLDRSKGRTHLFGNKKFPKAEYFMNTGAGKTGFLYEYRISNSSAFVQLVINNMDINWNKGIFDALYKNQAAIEDVFKFPLDWDRSINSKASHIKFSIIESGTQGIFQEKEKWPELQDKMIDAMIQLDKALRPFIQQID